MDIIIHIIMVGWNPLGQGNFLAPPPSPRPFDLEYHVMTGHHLCMLRVKGVLAEVETL